MTGELSHVDEGGRVRMVDVGGKPLSRRRATARATLRISPESAARLRELPKGDALAAAELAGIMAAKPCVERLDPRPGSPGGSTSRPSSRPSGSRVAQLWKRSSGRW